MGPRSDYGVLNGSIVVGAECYWNGAYCIVHVEVGKTEDSLDGFSNLPLIRVFGLILT